MAKVRGIHWPSPRYGQDFELLPEGKRLPYEARNRPHPLAVAALTALGLGFLLGASHMAIAGHRPPVVLVVILAVFAALGLSLLVGAGLCLRSTWLRITTDEVSCEALSGFRRVRWTEPLSGYRGILRRTVEGEDQTGAAAYHEILLYHEDEPSRCIKLYSSAKEEGFVARQKRLARLFALPALAETEDGFAEAALQDLDKPLRQKVQEGAVRIPVPASDAPADLRLSVDGQTMTMRTRRRPHPGFLIAGLIVAGIGAYDLWDTWRGQPWLAGAFGLTAGTIAGVSSVLAGVGLAFMRVLVVQVLQVSPDGATTWHELGPWRFGRESIAAWRVEEVMVARPNDHPLFHSLHLSSTLGTMPCPPAVNITGAHAAISFGHVLSKESRAWARDCIASVLAAGR